jgi:drug/metabolite transporter (DMT)-like permease
MTGAVFMMIFAFLAFGFTTITFKAVYFNYRHTIWEDIYGRGVAFFICSCMQYLTTDQGTQSIFDLRKSIRLQLFLRVLLISAAYVFLFLAIEWASSFLYVALILCVLPVACKIAQRYTLIDKNYSSWEMLTLLCAIIGMVFLFRSESNFVTKNKYINDLDFTYDNFSAYIYGILCIVCWAFANALLQKNKSYVHHVVDTFYVGFFTSMVIPAFILGYFSIHPTKLTYEWVQFGYFGITGFLWWLFHMLSTQVMQQDTRLSTFWTIYIYLAMTIVGDGIVRSKDLEWNQIIAFVLIVAPTFCQLLIRCLKGASSQ